MNTDIKRIGVLSSGGDSPGMNAAIRAVVRTAIFNQLEVFGILNGYEGLIDGKIKRLEKGDVGNIIQRGGTILKTARSQRFMTKEGRKQAYEVLQANAIDACIVIGGNGSLSGALAFAGEFDYPFIGLPGTIDNDLYGTDFSIGFDTAINTAMDAIDKIRDTADSHNRIFFVEVMGRYSGFIALYTGIGSGAGNVLIAHERESINDLIYNLKLANERDKLFSIIVVAEGHPLGGATEIAKIVSKHLPNSETKVTVIGHLQRGGSPTCMDRVLSSRLGYAAVEGLLQGRHTEMVGIIDNKIAFTPFYQAINNEKKVEAELLKLVEILA
jgi:6-phosphofructokinase 1